MELKQFIHGTLVDILAGINAAQEQIKSDGLKGIINPVWTDHNKLYEHVQNVNFDIAVTVSESISGSGQAGIKVISALDIGGKVGKEVSDSRISRVSFTVPIVPAYTPVSDVTKP